MSQNGNTQTVCVLEGGASPSLGFRGPKARVQSQGPGTRARVQGLQPQGPGPKVRDPASRDQRSYPKNSNQVDLTNLRPNSGIPKTGVGKTKGQGISCRSPERGKLPKMIKRIWTKRPKPHGFFEDSEFEVGLAEFRPRGAQLTIPSSLALVLGGLALALGGSEQG